MNFEKIKGLQQNVAQVRTGGKGSARKKKKVVHKWAACSDKKVQNNLKKLSVTSVVDTDEKTLALSMGILGEVKKKRFFSFTSRREFISMNLKVCLRGDQTPEQGQSVAEEIMQKLGIKWSQLVSDDYIDALVSVRT